MPSPRPPRVGERPGLVIGATTIWLDSTSIGHVGAALGARSIVGDRAGHNRLMEACYVVGSRQDRVRVHLTAQGFVHPSATVRGAMAAIPVWKASVARGDVLRRSSEAGECAPIPVPPSQIRWWNGLRLGMARVDAEHLLGAPKKSEGGEWVYEYDDPDFQMTVVDSATGRSSRVSVSVTYGIQVRYEGGVATRIEAWYATEPN